MKDIRDGSGLKGGSPSLLRTINARSVLDAIRRLGPVARPRIAEETHLSKPTVSVVLSGLVDWGLVLTAGKTTGGRGPNALLYDLNPRAGWVVGIDVGRQWLRGAVANIAGTVVARSEEPTSPSGGDALVSEIGELARKMAREAEVPWERVLHVTVGSPGVLDPARRVLAMAPNIPGWEREGLLGALGDELGTRVTVENDVNLAALGERALGHGRNVANFVFFSVGTGVGMGLVLNGELYRGASGAAGEIAYLPVGPGDPYAWRASRRGTYEEAAAADGVAQAAAAAGMEFTSARDVFEAARSGERRAARIVAEEARRITLGIAVVAPVLDPELIIIGGGVGRNVDLLLDPIERELRALSPFVPRIVASALGDDAVLHGSLATALQAAQETLFDGASRHARSDGRQQGRDMLPS
jgi:predicted NBD/HSP70 family sugar kinase